MDEIELELEELDLTTPECIEAICTLGAIFVFNFKGTGNDLLKFYENRTLTEAQMKAMIKDQQEKGLKYLKENKEEAQKFLEGGAPPKCPSAKELIAMSQVKLFYPLDIIYEKLEDTTGKKFDGTSTIEINKEPTDITTYSIDKLWVASKHLGFDEEESVEVVESVLLKKLKLKKKPWYKKIFN